MNEDTGVVGTSVVDVKRVTEQEKQYTHYLLINLTHFRQSNIFHIFGR